MGFRNRPEPPAHVVLRDDAETDATTAGFQNKPQPVKTRFHALTLTPGDLRKKSKVPSSANIENLKAQLNAAEKFLEEDTSWSNRKAWKIQRESNRDEVFTYLKSLAAKIDRDGDDDARRAYEDRVDLFNTVDGIHGLFLPKGFDDPTSRRFWGSLKEILNMNFAEESDDLITLGHHNIVRSMRATLRDFTQEVQAFLNVLSQASAEEMSKIALPREFVKAWLYVVMTMVFGAEEQPQWRDRCDRATALISQGIEKIMQGLSDIDFVERATVLPLDMLSLIAMGLLKDQVGKFDDIGETYSQYLNSLVR